MLFEQTFVLGCETARTELDWRLLSRDSSERARDPIHYEPPASSDSTQFSTSVLLHDMAGCFRANATYRLLDSFDIDFFRARTGMGYPRWPGRSCDCNPAENLGSVVMDLIEDALRLEPHPQRRETLVRVAVSVCAGMEFETALFTELNYSF